MTTVQLPVTPAAPAVAGLTPEVVTTSSLLTMPAVWNTVVERALPATVLLERYLIVLVTCALVAELVRRLGAGGALGPGAVGAASERHSPAATANGTTAPVATARQVDGFGEPDQLGAPLALDAPLDSSLGGPLDALDGSGGLGSLDDLDLDDLAPLDLAPLDLTADPFAESA